MNIKKLTNAMEQLESLKFLIKKDKSYINILNKLKPIELIIKSLKKDLNK